MSRNILLIRHVRIHNANALASPYSVGFPAMTAWMGAVHSLERKIKRDERFNEELDDLIFSSVGVVCHAFDLQTYKGQNNYDHVIIGTGNPLDKTGKRPSFIEEARCDLTVSLLIEYRASDSEELENAVSQLLPTIKLASGDIQHVNEIKRYPVYSEADQHQLIGQIMPGFCLIERRDLMRQAMQEGQDALDALLDYVKVTHHCEQNDDGKVSWISRRKEKGWMVPISVAYQGISELAQAEQQRDLETPHRFAESVVTLGEFIMPYRLDNLEPMLWRYQTNLEHNLYLISPLEIKGETHG